MEQTILLLTHSSPALLTRLTHNFRVIGPVHQNAVLTLPAIQRQAILAIVTTGRIGVCSEVISALPKLGLICCHGSGYEQVDFHAVRARGIRVTHSPGANSDSVADLAMALLLTSIRKITIGDTYIRAGKWRDAEIRVGPIRGLTGRNVGIVGLGEIGEKIALRLNGFKVSIAYHNRRRRIDIGLRYFESLLALATWCNVLILCCRAGPENRHMVGEEVLRALGPDGHIINVARGSLIDEDDLVSALRTDLIAGAGLDVFDNEPNVRTELRELHNVVLTPHLGDGTIEAREAMTDLVLANLRAFFTGMSLPTPVP